MQNAAHIHFRCFQQSSALERYINECLDKVNRRNGEFTSSRVVVEKALYSRQHEMLFRVSISMIVSHKNCTVSRRTHGTNKDVFVAVSDAFNSMERRLDAYALGRGTHATGH